MSNKILSPFAAIALIFVAIAFAVTIFGVFVTKGKSEFWIDKKLKLGGIVLTLISIVSCTSSGIGCHTTCYEVAREPEQVSCYDVPCSDVLNLEQDSIEISKTQELKGNIYDCTKEKYSFALIKDQDTVQSGEIKFLQEDSSKTSTNSFLIMLDKKISEGDYVMIIYDENPKNVISSYNFSIVK
jgi:hypothetical protein